MNSIHGIIHDLEDEETVIGGCTTAGEVIIALQSLVEQNNSLKEKLEQIERIIKRTEGILGLDNYTVQQIKEVLEKE
jgi:hypothetical protein